VNIQDERTKKRTSIGGVQNPSVALMAKELQSSYSAFLNQNEEMSQSIDKLLVVLQQDMLRGEDQLDLDNPISDRSSDSDSEHVDPADVDLLDVEEPEHTTENLAFGEDESFRHTQNLAIGSCVPVEKRTLQTTDLSEINRTDTVEADLEEDGATAEESTPGMPGPDWWRMRPDDSTLAPADAGGTPVVDVVDIDAILDSEKFIALSNKVLAFLTLLGLSVTKNLDDGISGGKVLLFSQSLPALDLIEEVLSLPNWGSLVGVTQRLEAEGIRLPCPLGGWKLGKNYLRLDGSTKDRQKLIDNFNKSPSLQLFLVSTKAGNMGVNLVSANRVVIFDSNWNPAYDLQATYRCYRYGQSKPVFVYRFLAAGSMEEKIYKKQVTKMTLSARVVDAQMPDNHFTAAERAELLCSSVEHERDSEDILQEAYGILQNGVDPVLRAVLDIHKNILHQLIDQDPFLEDREDEHLNEEEQAEALAEFDKEVNGPPALFIGQGAVPVPGMSYPGVGANFVFPGVVGNPAFPGVVGSSTSLDISKVSGVLVRQSVAPATGDVGKQ